MRLLMTINQDNYSLIKKVIHQFYDNKCNYKLYTNYFQLNILFNMYGCETMLMGGEPIEKSSEDDTSIWGLCRRISC